MGYEPPTEATLHEAFQDLYGYPASGCAPGMATRLYATTANRERGFRGEGRRADAHKAPSRDDRIFKTLHLMYHVHWYRGAYR